MKNALGTIYRCIVGPEFGFTGEGSEQWYYSLAIVMNLMLVWWLKPEIALIFTILAAIHYLTVVVYGFFDLEFASVNFAYAYAGINIALLLFAIVMNFSWAVITAGITVVALVLAPDCTGNNIFLRKLNDHSKLPLLFNTIIFGVFVGIDFLLPINVWIKLGIIGGALIIHPIIDWLEGEGIIISDVTRDVIEEIDDNIR